jgi:hypothetical protein
MTAATGKPWSGSRQDTVAGWHPWWCDRDRCTADPYPATKTAGYGEHLSAPMGLDLDGTWGIRLSLGRDRAFLSQAGAPWPCETYLRVRVADLRVSLPVQSVVRVLEGLLALCAMAETEARSEVRP